MKFDILEEDSRSNARLGNLKINDKILKTPLLWLGASIRSKPYPWLYFSVNAVMINAYELFQKNYTISSIHDFLNINGSVMMDSGGFQLFKKNIKVSPEDILNIYKNTKPDIGVILDYPFDPLKLDNRFERWRETLRNTEFMLNNSHDTILMPVIHGYTIDDVKRACKEIKDITNPKIIGIGSLVPLIKSMGTARLSRINGSKPEKLIIDVVTIVRKEFPDAFMHVFGIGSVTTMHLLFYIGVDSVDSVSWRLKAAYGAVQLPGVGDRFVTPSPGRKKLSEYSLLECCACPICKNKSIEEKINALDNASQHTFCNRAIHNAYVFKKEEEAFQKALQKERVHKFVKDRLKKTKYSRLLKILDEKFFN